MSGDTLFDLGPVARPKRGAPPADPSMSLSSSAPVQSRRDGLAKAQAEGGTVRDLVLQVLRRAGAHGLTLCEIAEQVSELRGKFTKETSISQPLEDVRECDPPLVKAGGRRMGNAGMETTVWVICEGTE